ncbi:MAG: hypothetical protein KIS76_15380 [Pyrinomonadaceae bacterium]|nr:hypothetical protein [Pyrinomonadaceae bacterium]
MQKSLTLCSIEEQTQLDILGRVKAHKQTTDGQSYTTGYVYNFSGAMVEQVYPSGRVVKNVLDNDGQLSTVQSKKNANFGFWNYADSFTYTAAGAVSSMQLGNGKWESTQFNSRLQPTQIALGTVQNSTDKLKLNFTYNTPGLADNNGNVLSQTITVPTEVRNNITYNGFTANQAYIYDSLNRIEQATETVSGQTGNNWQQTFDYDRYGNRTFDELNTTTLPKNCVNGNQQAIVCANMVAQVNPSANTGNNRLNGYSFDNSGNTILDAQSRKFTYDGENKQVKVETVDANGNPVNTIGIYEYDGDGRRVKKISATEITVFVYNASGQLVADYSTNIEPAQTARVSYLTSDHLGSPRITTDRDGKVFSRRDFMPFGEEITAAQTPQRSINQNYGEDGIRQKFTSYERDFETELDFAQARMYSSKLGRFASSDPVFLTIERIRDPQRLQLYVYSRNNPLKFIDPDGKDVVISGSDEGKARKKYEVILKGLKSKDRKKVSFFVGEGKDGYKTGEFYVLVDKDHKSKSENFNALQSAANNRDELVKTTVLAVGDSYSVAYYSDKEDKKVLVTASTGFNVSDFEGYTLFQARGEDVGNLSSGPYNEILINGEQSDVEIAATFFHELSAHVLLGDYGRNVPNGVHTQECAENWAGCTPGNDSDKQGKRSEEEARENAKKKN